MSQQNDPKSEIEIIPSDWKNKRIGDCCYLVRKQFLPSKGDIRPYIGLEHIEQQTLRLNDIGSTEDIKSNKFIFKSGQILFGKLRPYFRKLYLPKFNGVCSTDIWVIDTKEGNDTSFFFYFLADKRIIDEADYSSEGTKMPRAKWNYLEKLEYPIPSQNEQRAISKILSDLDSKIELNQQMNKTLESIGENLFKNWFIDFEFPNDAGKPYKSNGGEMVYSEGFDKEIPKGWTILTMKDLSDLMMGVSPKSSTYNENMEGMPLLNGAADFSNNMIQPRKYTTNPIRISKFGDLIFCIRATIGNLTIADKKYCLGRGVSALTPKSEKYTEFIYYHLKRLFDLLISQAAGSVILGLSKPDIEEIKILLPKDGIVDNYHQIINPLFIKKNSLLKENITISQIRDALLPKLMSGQIRVPVEEVS